MTSQRVNTKGWNVDSSPNLRGVGRNDGGFDSGRNSMGGYAQAQANNPNKAKVAGRKSWGGETSYTASTNSQSMSSGSAKSRGYEAPNSKDSQSQSGNHRMFPKTQPNHGTGPGTPNRPIRTQQPRPSPLMQPQEMPVQLSNIKKQWDVQRDIPSGTVKNNPFVPKPEPGEGPPPQLVHQKRQWDTSGIQRGSVASRAMSMEGNIVQDALSPTSRVSPQMQQYQQRFDKGGAKNPSGVGASPSRFSSSTVPQQNRRSFPFDNINRADQDLAPPELRRVAPPLDGASSLRGRLIENPFLPTSQEKNIPQGTPSKWEPSREIPAGAVKGRVNKMFSPVSNTSTVSNFETTNKSRVDTLQVSTKPLDSPKNDQPSFDDEASDDDPWIIPTKKSGPEAFPGNWGEAVPVKSSESDDWDSPATDWIKSSESQTTMSKPLEKTVNIEKREPKHKDPLNLGILEEKKLNEDDSLLLPKDPETLHWPIQKKVQEPIENDPFGTTHARDAEVLQAARQKASWQKTSTKSQKKHDKPKKPSVDVFEVFSSDVNADFDGFPAEPFNDQPFSTIKPKDTPLDFAFPTSPFGGKSSGFHNFSSTVTLETKQVDLPSSEAIESTVGYASTNASMTLFDNDYFMEPSQQDPLDFTPPKAIATTSRFDRHNAPPMREMIELTDIETKKQKKGFLNKLFGGGRKAKKSLDDKERLSPSPQPDDFYEVPGHVKVRPKESRVVFGKKANLGQEPSMDPPARFDFSKEQYHDSTQGMPTGTSPHPEIRSKGNLEKSRAKTEDETTVSEVTIPTILKETIKAPKDMRNNGPALLETVPSRGSAGTTFPKINESFQDPELLEQPNSDSDSDVEQDSFIVDIEEKKGNGSVSGGLSAQLRDPTPPPPPPPPRQVEELGAPIAKADSIEKARLKSEMETVKVVAPKSSASSIDTARFNRKMKSFKNNPTRHQAAANTMKKKETEEAISAKPKEVSVVAKSHKVPVIPTQSTPKTTYRMPERTPALSAKKGPNIDMKSQSPAKPQDQSQKKLSSFVGKDSITDKVQDQNEKKVPNFVVRHVKTKHGKIQPAGFESAVKESQVVPTKVETAQNANLGKYDKKFSKASKAFEQGKRANKMSTSSSTSTNSTIDDSHPGPLQQRSTVKDGSLRSIRTTDSISVGSDIRILRTILRRPRKEREVIPVPRPKQVFASYDENNVTDPMQRAGLRLLSAAIIPIQSEVRRFLAMRRALTRMWALIVIQSYVRRWMARKEYLVALDSVVLIQAVCRGHQQRNDLMYQHICAIEIQRHVRGYLSTMRVYEDIYKVTMVQSYVRMKLAMEEATNRMALVIQLQSVARGFLVRRRLEYQEACAVAIQANWRCFFTRLTYQFDLLDVIIVQSVWRRKVAIQETQRRRQIIQECSATVIQANIRCFVCRSKFLRQRSALRIQTRWRSHQCRSRYTQHRSAMKIQTKWRSYDCRSKYLRHVSAMKIQTKWRSYDCRSNYLRHVSAMKIQNKWRSYDCRSKYLRYRGATKMQAAWRRYDCRSKYLMHRSAVKIQALWRCHVWRTKFVRHKSAIIIQTKWRSYDATMNYLHYLADVLIVQSTIRRFLAKKRVTRIKNDAATKIQSVWRGFVCYADYMFSIADIVVTQKIARRWMAIRRTKKIRHQKQTMAAVTLQRTWRKFLYARRIQRAWRLKVFRRNREKAALIIQKRWRGFVDETEYVVMKYEYYAARTIQSYWRRFWCFSNYVIALDCAIQIQATFRAHRQRVKFNKEKRGALHIQKHVRGFLAKKTLSTLALSEQIRIGSEQLTATEHHAATLIQAKFRSRQARVAFKAYLAARKIQSRVRGMQARTAVSLYVCARRIQAVWRGQRMYKAYRYYCSARRIQAVWRGKRLRSAYVFYRAALQIQTRFRGMKARREVIIRRGEFLAASLIQSAWRGFVCYTDYIFTISDIISAQKIARRYIAQQKYAWQIRARVVQRKMELSAALTIQKVTRGFVARQKYWYILGCTMQIQSWFRGRVIFKKYRREKQARLTLQCFARRCLARQEYLQRKFIMALLHTAENERKKRIAAMVIQERCRNYLGDRKRDDAARVIQRFFLMVKQEVDQMVQATKRRKTWRKKMKTRNDRVEDDLLEDAWASAVDKAGFDLGCDSLRFQDSGSGQNENIGSNARITKELPTSSSRGRGELKDSAKKSLDNSWRPKTPLQYSDKPSPSIRGQREDKKSEYSVAASPSTTSVNRLSTFRWKRPDSQEIDEDHELEKAFVDAEIFSSKQSNSSKKVNVLARWPPARSAA